MLNKTFVNGEWQFVCLPFSLNAADIETIFGKGTEVEELEPLEIDFANNNEADGEETPFELWYNPVSEMEAGCPYRIRPTDALASPITLQHVRVTRKEPWSFHQGGILISGTFQKTDEAQAFSAILTDDPNSIGEAPGTTSMARKRQITTPLKASSSPPVVKCFGK